jgi:hypothetical protein
MPRPRKWTPETILASIRHFVAIQQRVPRARDFYHGVGALPHTATVRQHFLDEASAVRAAGFEPIPLVTRPARSHIWRRTIPRRKQGR